MTRSFFVLAAAAVLPLLCSAAEVYTLGPDSQRKPEVPQGTVTQHKWTESKVFPGSVRDYWVYAPPGEDKTKPLPVMIFQDGSGFVRENGTFRGTVVLDNLIASKAIPPMLAIFIDPGVMPASGPDKQARYNRSYEYDATSDRYARFLIEEILPEVGKSHNISTDPNDRGLAGSSSGAAAAFTAAWYRPDQFRRVISFIGSYTNLRGANEYADLIRKMEPKPLRIFLQDGENDLNIYSGSWWMANQSMAMALRYAGYETTFVHGTESHNGKHGSAILPYAMRWLWAGYPKQIANIDNVKDVERHYIREFLDPASDWQVVSEGHSFTEGPTVDAQGNLYFVDVNKNTIHRVDAASGKVSTFAQDTGRAKGLAFGPDGKLYSAGDKGVIAYDASGKASPVVTGIAGNDLAITTKGGIYFSEPAGKKVWFIPAGNPAGKRAVVENTQLYPNGVRLSTDESLLLVADYATRYVWSYQIQPDGSLANGEPYYKLEIPEEPNRTLGNTAGADGMTVDNDGHLYVATGMGVQICDQPGRVVGIIRKPSTAALTNVTFGGPHRMTLYATSGDKVWKRHLRRTGLMPLKPVMPSKPRL